MKLWTCVLLLCAAAVCVTCEQPPSDEDWLELDTPQGPVRGRRDPNSDIYAFYNIPYVTQPLNEDKYKPALPAPVWTKPFDAVNKHVICPQPTFHIDLMPKHMVMQEDCLIANVFVPDTRKKNLSVLVYVHGGAFVMGYGEMFSGKRLIEKKDVVLVTFNYRLGIHGFLCLGTDDVPGNVGMKDQVALLRWVQKNIASYGGNPNDVTIAGYSAGSASVDLLMLSKSAEGLFHRVIPESGGNLAAFSIQRDPLEIAKDYAKRYNFTEVDDIYALEKFYKTAPIEWITEDTFFDRHDSTFLFSPCVERKTTDEAFLTESPLSILQKGTYKKLPLLYGFAEKEGMLRLWSFEYWKHMMNENFSDFLPADLHFKSKDEREAVADKVKKFYFGDKPVGDDQILNFIDMFSDIIFDYPMLRAVKLHVQAGHNQVYLYEYSFVDEDTPLIPYTNIRGANHCAQTGAIMDGLNMTHLDESSITPAMKNMKKIMRGIWHNFVKTGKPVPEGSSLPAWPATGVDCSPYMSLGEKIELRNEPLLESRFRFWDDIYQKYYLEPIPPPAPGDQSHQEL
ncbi:juvenile hormone esterase-like [Trichoplusia ni]|uniref:Juvenile hormone esterase-like n=1 Tax=Trichoplusia ni TaxID=7111 RepID=A0A7E5VDG7_TRINI|nr:juvenile hormone esterase-like [Trichoplusia ni]